MEHEFITAVTTGLARQGVRVVRFEFPYMAARREDGKRRPPDRMPKLLAAYQSLYHHYADQGPLVMAGKSMGGRVATLLAQELESGAAPLGVICLGFPFHPPGKPERYRGEHLATTTVPTLILQGERDPFGTREELRSFALSAQVECCFLTDGEHSFKPRKSSGTTLEENLNRAVSHMVDFIGRQLT
nr:alpha/beta family hydrolase [Motiliproteus sediminis]